MAQRPDYHNIEIWSCRSGEELRYRRNSRGNFLFLGTLQVPIQVDQLLTFIDNHRSSSRFSHTLRTFWLKKSKSSCGRQNSLSFEDSEWETLHTHNFSMQLAHRIGRKIELYDWAWSYRWSSIPSFYRIDNKYRANWFKVYSNGNSPSLRGSKGRQSWVLDCLTTKVKVTCQSDMYVVFIKQPEATIESQIQHRRVLKWLSLVTGSSLLRYK